MVTKQKSIQAKANILPPTEGLTVEKKITWEVVEEIAKKIGIVASLLVVLGFIISVAVFLFSVHNHFVNFSNTQTAKVDKLIEKQAQLEGKLEMLLEDRREILDSYKNVLSTPSVQQSEK